MITVIVSVLNDERGLTRTLASLVPEKAGKEILVVDGGSVDHSARLARETPWVRLVKSTGSKGVRLNAAAARARGEVLLFVDSGTVLERGWAAAVEKAAGVPGFALGCFRLEVQHRNPAFRAVEWAAFLRTAIWHVCRSSQGIFVKRSDVQGEQVFCDVAALEDLDLSRRMRARGKTVQVRQRAIVSANRWTRDGIIRRCLLDTRAFFRWLRGDQPNALAALAGERQKVVLLFCALPKAGARARPGAGLDPALAADVYRSGVDQILATVKRARIDSNPFVFYRPKGERDAFLQWLGDEAVLVGQTGKTDAERRRAAIRTAFDAQCDTVLVLDAQCPAVTESHLQEALTSLDTHDLVVGPTGDGGCYLVGLKQPLPEGFDDVSWAGDDLVEQIGSIGREHRLKIANLEPLKACEDVEGLVYNWAMGHVQV